MADTPTAPQPLHAMHSKPLRQKLRERRILQPPRARRSENLLPAAPYRSLLFAHGASFAGCAAAITAGTVQGAANPIPQPAVGWPLMRSLRKKNNRRLPPWLSQSAFPEFEAELRAEAGSRKAEKHSIDHSSMYP